MSCLRAVPAVLLLSGCFLVEAPPAEVAPPVPRCGDGTQDEGEGCDHGSLNGTDGSCDEACAVVVGRCGDGLLQPAAGERCDEGAANGDRFGACTTTCGENRCGDGRTDEGEACDAGGGNSDWLGACSQSCTVARCGDLRRSRDESCDGTVGCTSDCRLARCGARQVVAWAQTTLVLLDDGGLVGAGSTAAGQLGGEPDPLRVTQLRAVLPGVALRRVALQRSNGAGITEAGSLVIWGLNTSGQFGLGSSAPSSAPQELVPGPGWIDLALGRDTVFALRADGAVFGAGAGLERFGADEQQSCPFPDDAVGCAGLFRELVPAGRGFVSLSAGDEHLVALDAQGVVHTWGCGSTGELGRGEVVQPAADCTTGRIDDAPKGLLCDPIPTPVQGQPAAAVQAVAGGRSTAWIDRDGVLFSVGYNCSKVLGLEPEGFVAQAAPTGVLPSEPVTPFVFVASGLRHFGAALDASGTLWSYGAAYESFFSNDRGRLRRPEELLQLDDLVELAVGDEHTVARHADGSVFVIGSNESGQRGTGEPVRRKDLQYWTRLELSPFCAP